MIARSMGLGFYGQTIIKFVLSICILIIPSTMMGVTLPILSKELSHKWDHFAKDIGNLYAVNTVGAVAGAVLTAYYLIPSVTRKNTTSLQRSRCTRHWSVL